IVVAGLGRHAVGDAVAVVISAVADVGGLGIAGVAAHAVGLVGGAGAGANAAVGRRVDVAAAHHAGRAVAHAVAAGGAYVDGAVGVVEPHAGRREQRLDGEVADVAGFRGGTDGDGLADVAGDEAGAARQIDASVDHVLVGEVGAAAALAAGRAAIDGPGDR